MRWKGSSRARLSRTSPGTWAGLEPEDTALGVLTIEDLPLPPETAEAVFAAAEGQYPDPQQSDFGWHVYRINEVIPGETTSLEEAREELRRELALRRAADSLFELANRLEDELAGGATLEEGASRLDLNAGNIPRIDADGRAPDGADVETRAGLSRVSADRVRHPGRRRGRR